MACRAASRSDETTDQLWVEGRSVSRGEIFRDEMVDLMRQVMRGEVSPAMTAAILAGLRVKKETVGEIAGAALVMLGLLVAVPAMVAAYVRSRRRRSQRAAALAEQGVAAASLLTAAAVSAPTARAASWCLAGSARRTACR